MLRRLQKELEKVFAAAAFAEAGEQESAVEIMGYPKPKRTESILERIGRLSMAVSFAEANCHDMVMEVMDGGKRRQAQDLPSFLEAVGLEGVRVRYGLVEV